MTATQDIRTTTYDNILVERDAPIATITLNRPEKRNALSVPLMEELIAAFAAIGRDKTIQAVILAANGPAFSAAHHPRAPRDRAPHAHPPPLPPPPPPT